MQRKTRLGPNLNLKAAVRKGPLLFWEQLHNSPHAAGDPPWPEGRRKAREKPKKRAQSALSAAPTVTLLGGHWQSAGLRRLCGLSLEPAAAALARVGWVRAYVPPGKHWHWQRHSQAGTVPAVSGWPHRFPLRVSRGATDRQAAPLAARRPLLAAASWRPPALGTVLCTLARTPHTHGP
jgi:hypothetical protein